jgi:septal ring-binding cell division protein DamX
VALSPLPPAPQPPPAAEKPAKKGQKAQRLMAWPSTNGYSIVLASLPLAVGANAARAKAFSALRKGLRQVGVLVSSSYPSLQPGYYVVFTGIFPSKDAADAAVSTARQAGFGGAYSRQIAR